MCFPSITGACTTRSPHLGLMLPVDRRTLVSVCVNTLYISWTIVINVVHGTCICVHFSFTCRLQCTSRISCSSVCERKGTWIQVYNVWAELLQLRFQFLRLPTTLEPVHGVYSVYIYPYLSMFFRYYGSLIVPAIRGMGLFSKNNSLVSNVRPLRCLPWNYAY